MPEEKNAGPGDTELSEARSLLYAQQALNALKTPAARQVHLESPLGRTLRELRQQTQVERTDDPDTVKRRSFRFDRKKEEQRIELAEGLIRRVGPSPWEDPNYLAILAYQAASVEMVFAEYFSKHRNDARWARFLLGTVHSAEVNSFGQVSSPQGYTIVALNSGLVDFIYQAAKAVVAAQNPVRSTDHQFLVSASVDPKDVEAELDRNREPVERLYRTLEAYFFKGYPRAFAYESVKREHLPVLETVVGLAERWAIAHEYGHGFATGIDWQHAPVRNPSWAEEFFADMNATVLTVLSASQLDAMPPECALSAGIFALACLDIVRRAICILRSGKVSADVGDDAHPPHEERAAGIIEVFHRFFAVTYDDKACRFELLLTLDQREPRKVDESVKEHIGYAFAFANDLFTIWMPVSEMLRKDHAAGRPLHPMWR